MNSNEVKAKALGIPYGTANNKLKKALLFKFSQLLDMDICFQCKEKIMVIEEFSIEHKIPWLYTDNPLGNFLDLNNIAFSHAICNTRAGKKVGWVGQTYSRKPVALGMAWCGHCGEKPVEAFSLNKHRWNGLQDLCIECRSKYRS